MNWFEIICLIIVSVNVVFVLLSLGAISNSDRRLRLIDAIFSYQMKRLVSKEFDKAFSVDYDDINSPGGLWDYLPWNWSYKKLLPPDKLEIIKPYL